MALMNTLQREPNWAQGPQGLFVQHGVQILDLKPQQPQAPQS
jgi:hypothetical protein